ncbi:MAG: hypothetical protein HY905_15725 [Deltaproteobacteria bacterium]|nr:hypothetical protein [Deltaproteobacteria bacterium]
MENAVPMTVLMRDPGCAGTIRSAGSMRVVRSADAAGVNGTHNVFVLALASELGGVTEYVRRANQRHVLRALLVRADVEPRWVAQMLDRADLRTLRNLLVHRGPELPRRVLGAWRLAAQDDLIADATVVKDMLFVLSCALERFELPFARLPALAAIPPKDRAQLEVADDGSYISWPSADVHLDIEAVRVALDPAARDRALHQKLVHDRRFGLAVAKLREVKGLRQSGVGGVSARQLRRIEAGEFFPRLDTLKRMAAAHGMKLAEYLDALAQTR